MAGKGRRESLRRKVNKADPKVKFILFCEGENTEPVYFRALKMATKDVLVDIDIVGAAGVPLTIARRSVSKIKELKLTSKRKSKLNSFEVRDQVWAVFDRDTHPNFSEALNLCSSNGVGVARSDPCFELWLILHIEDYDRPDEGHVVRRRLATLRPDYDHQRKKTIDCRTLIANLSQAEERAERLHARRVADGSARPLTTVFELTRALRPKAG